MSLTSTAPRLAFTTRTPPGCVLGCHDATRTDVWPRPPRPRADGLLTCRPCADRILTTLDEVLELAVTLDLVLAAGSAPRASTGRKRIKDEPVAPVPVSLAASALTDVRSSHGTWVPPAPTEAPTPTLDEHGRPYSVDQLRAAVDRERRFLAQMIDRFGPRSAVARTALEWFDGAQYRLREATRPTAPISNVSPTDGDPASVVGFLDRWTDRVRLGRDARLDSAACPARIRVHVSLRTGPLGGRQGWPRTVACGQPAEYRRLIRVDAGARTTGLFLACPAGHVTRPAGQGAQPLATRGPNGHRATTGIRHGQTLHAGVGFLRRHNEWICSQAFVTDYRRALDRLRTDLGRAHGEQAALRVGRCITPTGELDPVAGRAGVCGKPLQASSYSDTIECTRCGTTWNHTQWRALGRRQGVIA